MSDTTGRWMNDKDETVSEEVSATVERAWGSVEAVAGAATGDRSQRAEAHQNIYSGDARQSQNRIVTGLFRDRDSAERAYGSLESRGYSKDDVNILMSDETRHNWFGDDADNLTGLGDKALEGAGFGSAIGGTIGAILAAIAAIGTNVVLPGLGLVIAGPLAAALAGAGAGGLTGGLIGALVGSGIPEDQAKEYEEGIRSGGMVMGVNPRNDEDAEYFEREFKNYSGESVYGSAFNTRTSVSEEQKHKSQEEHAKADDGVKTRNTTDKPITVTGSTGSSSSGSTGSSGSGSNPPGGSGPPPNGDPNSPPLAAQTVTCYFHAEMYEEVIINRVTTVEVNISREMLERDLGAAAKLAKSEINPHNKLIIQIIPKLNFETIDDGRLEIEPPALGQPQTLYFDVRAVQGGEGEIWVIARQGQLPLVTLSLKCRIVERKSRAAGEKSSSNASATQVPPLSKPIHEMSIIEIGPTDYISYIFDFNAPLLGIRRSLKTPEFRGNRQEYVENIYKQIEQRWIDNSSDVDNFVAELRAYGGQLFDELFPDELRRLLWNNRDKIKQIQVTSNEPFIPWELIHLKEPGVQHLPDETLFLGQMGLIRWLYNVETQPSSIKLRDGRARYVIPQYPDPRFRLPEAEREFEFLEKTFGATRVAPHLKEVRKLLESPGSFDLLHFACHGHAEQDNITNAHLMLEGHLETVFANGKKEERYRPEYFQAAVAEGYSRLKASDNRPMVVLNACQTGRAGYNLTGIGGFAKAFLGGGAGAFVGTLWSVGDRPARTFTETLYSQLKHKKAELADAVVAARNEAQRAGDATWLAYAVYGHPHMTVQD